MVNLKALSSTDPKLNSLRESEFFRISDSNNLYLRVKSVNRRILCSNSELKYGIGTSQQIYKLDIKDTNGECLRLVHGNDQAANFTVTSDGALNIQSTNGLTLSKPLETQSGGTSFSNYADGDLLVGENGTLKKLQRSNNIGYQLISDGNSISWSSHVLENYMKMSNPVFQSSGVFLIRSIHCRNYLDSNFIVLKNPILSTLLSSSVLGNVIVASDTNSLSLDATEFNIGDTITIQGVSKKIVTTSPSTVVISSTFNFYNLWTLVGTASLSTAQFRFGSKSLLATSTAMYSVLTLGSLFPGPSSSWTLEFFFRLNSTTAQLSLLASNVANTIAINSNTFPNNLTVSLGQGSSFNIMNAVRLGTTLVANTWYHFAISFNGTSYRSFINGTLLNTTNSSLQIPANSFTTLKVAGGANTFNGYLDEFRLSKVSRYSANFTAPTTAFVDDADTLSLNHFDNVNISQSDDNYSGSLPYSRNGGYDLSSFHILNTIASDLGVYYSFRGESNLVDLGSLNYRQLPFYNLVLNGNIQAIRFINGFHIFPNYINFASGLTSTSQSIISLSQFIPISTTMIRILLTHTHVGNTSAGIYINNIIYLTTARASDSSLIIDIPITNQNITTYLSATASTTSYSIQLVGFVADII